MGPNTEPWGTPDNTGAGSEQTPSMKTFCDRPDSQAVINHNTPDYTLAFDVALYRKPWQSP